MNRWILIVMVLVLSLYSCSSNQSKPMTRTTPTGEGVTTKVAILPLKALDSPSRYIQKILTVRDIKEVFVAHHKYGLMDMALTESQFKATGFRDVDDLQIEEMKEISKGMFADVMIMGNISESRPGLYTISMRFYSTRSGELKQHSFVVGKEKNARYKVLNESFMGELDRFVSTEVEKIFNIGVNYYVGENYPEAEKSLKSVIALNPEKREGYYYLGSTYFKMGKYKDAETNLLKAMQMEKTDQRATYMLIELYEKSGELAKRIALMETVAETNQDEELWLVIGNLYDEAGEPAKAKQAFIKSLAVNPNYPLPQYRLAFMLFDEQKYGDAIPYLEKAFEQYPDNDLIAQKLATAYRLSNRLGEAITKYETLIKNDPQNVQAYLNVVGLYRLQAGEATDGKTIGELNKKAIDTINTLKKIDPENALVYLNLAAIYLSQNKNADAETNANLAIQKNPTIYQAYVILATVTQSKGTEQYNKFIDLEKQAAKAVGKKADDLKKQRDAAKASANSFFRRADEQLKTARSKTTDKDAVSDINARSARLTNLISQSN
ncbi:MAG: tetratricopeptide repeat protein [Candidatus Cloacimonadaceae bacterium]|nr:tetratricopeptide repeat protein [Candidatus Cloacimonadaceae bacterium]